MEKNKSLVEEAIINMKNLEEVIAENAKGILASTMKEEISELVKESLNETKTKSDVEEQDDEEIMGMMDDESEMEDEEMDVQEPEEEDEEGEMEMSMDIEEPEEDEMEDETIDLTDFPMDEVIKVFKAAKPEDEIIVKKEGGYVHLKDDGDEYLISMNESEEDDELISDEYSEEEMDEMSMEEEDMDEVMYEIEMEEEMDEMSMEEEDEDEVMYEIEMEDEDEDDDLMDLDIEDEYIYDDEDEDLYDEGYEPMVESKMTVKPKGVGMGHASKAKYPKTLKHGTTESKKKVTKKAEAKEGKMSVKPVGKGIGKGPKFTYKEGEKMEATKGMKDVKKSETKEAARTLGNGRRFGKPGLPKPKAAPRHLNLESEVRSLRDKNEEYRKALNIFRDKLNEVAIFNANLAYATRLFTEHSTTKQEKINILRRFDSIDSLKESKALYKTIKEELNSNDQGKLVKESIETVIDRNPTSGSAVNLIENKTYENPQFLRMKDLMSKLK